MVGCVEQPQVEVGPGGQRAQAGNFQALEPSPWQGPPGKGQDPRAASRFKHSQQDSGLSHRDHPPQRGRGTHRSLCQELSPLCTPRGQAGAPSSRVGGPCSLTGSPVPVRAPTGPLSALAREKIQQEDGRLPPNTERNGFCWF